MCPARSGAMQIDIMRHGEPVGGRRYRGDRVDDPLSELGWTQMRARVAACAAAGQDDWTMLVASPLARCRAFAEALAEERGLPLFIDHNLREIGFGEWEGLAHAEVPLVFPEQYRAFKADPVNGRPAGAEDMNAFFDRVSGALTRWATSSVLDSGGKILVIGHAVVMRAALVWVTAAPLHAIARVNTEYASLLSLRWRANQPQLIGLNND